MHKSNKKSKKKNTKNTVHPKNEDKPIFCTECDTDLSAFWLSPVAEDPEKVKQMHENCRRSGKFHGEICSKLFIINDIESDDIFDIRD